MTAQAPPIGQPAALGPPPAPARRSLRRRFGYKAFAYTMLGVATIVTLLPFVWMVSASFKPVHEILSYPPKIMPETWTLLHYVYIFEQAGFARFLVNSAIVTTATITGHVLTGSLVAYGFARLRFPGRNILFLATLATLMVPFHAYLVPRYLIMRELGVLDTLVAVFLPYLFGGPFYIFLMRQFFMSIPRDVADAAKVDGCGAFRAYWYVFLPLAKPAIATVVVLEFLASWTSFLEPLIYLSSQENFTVTLGLSLLQAGFGGQVQWGPMMAATTVSALPPIIAFFIAQRHLVTGLGTVTAVRR